MTAAHDTPPVRGMIEPFEDNHPGANLSPLPAKVNELIEAVNELAAQVGDETAPRERARLWEEIAYKNADIVADLRAALEQDREKWSFDTLVFIARQLLEKNYPAHIFVGTSGDAGAAFVVRLREALTALEARS